MPCNQSRVPRTRPARATLALLAAGVAGATVAACVPSMTSSYRSGTPLMTQTLDARDLVGIRVDAGVGDVELRATAGDSVRVDVSLRSSDADRLARECIPNASLETRREGGALVLHVEQRTRDRCGTRWRVELPARLHARVRADVGDVTVTGVAGGLDVETGNGDVVVTAPAAGQGAVMARSDVGRVRLCVLGYDVPPAERRGAGMTAELRREGGPTVSLRSRVGSVTARLDGEASGERCPDAG